MRFPALRDGGAGMTQRTHQQPGGVSHPIPWIHPISSLHVHRDMAVVTPVSILALSVRCASVQPSAFPLFSGPLNLPMFKGVEPTVRRLLSLPNGLDF